MSQSVWSLFKSSSLNEDVYKFTRHHLSARTDPTAFTMHVRDTFRWRRKRYRRKNARTRGVKLACNIIRAVLDWKHHGVLIHRTPFTDSVDALVSNGGGEVTLALVKDMCLYWIMDANRLLLLEDACMLLTNGPTGENTATFANVVLACIRACVDDDHLRKTLINKAIADRCN
jgi:hypothetical protein